MNIHENIKNARKSLLFALVLSVLVLPASIAFSDETDSGISLAIVVHKELKEENLSLDELRQIFLAERQFWSDRSRIILLVRAPKSDERDFVLNTIYQMDEGQFRQYWIAKMFRAEVPRGPKVVFSTDMTRDLIVAISGSISFLNAKEVTDDVKVLRIDGMLPADEGYPLK